MGKGHKWVKAIPPPPLPALTGTVGVSGTAQVGQTLTANVAGLGGAGAVSFQWRRGNVNVGAGGGTLFLTAADAGQRITVTVTRAGNSGSVVSAPTAVVAAAPPAQPAPPPRPAPSDMVRVQGGTFRMNGRRVTLSAFNIGRFPVTQGEWFDVMGTWPSFFTGTNAIGDNLNMITVTPAFDRRNLPVESVSWFDAVEFANAMSRRAGLTPAYAITSLGANRVVTWNRNANGCRLPTDAEWEFAARGGVVCRGNFTFSGSNVAAEVAWGVGNSGGRTHEVGTRRPNALGIYDMSGNVWEWVWDWHGTYPSIAETNPVGASSGSGRVLRGGCWSDAASFARSAIRNRNDPSHRWSSNGFRLVRSP